MERDQVVLLEGLESEESDARQSAYASTGSRRSRTGSKRLNQIQEAVFRREAAAQRSQDNLNNMTAMMQWQVNRQFRKDRKRNERTVANFPFPSAADLQHVLAPHMIVLTQTIKQLGFTCVTLGILLEVSHLEEVEEFPQGRKRSEEDKGILGEYSCGKICSHNDQLASSIEAKLREKSSLKSRRCIFKIPNMWRKHNREAFIPNLVSIGPYHHGKKKLQAMEETKLWYLHCLLARQPTPDTNLKYFVQVIRSSEQYYLDCYAKKFDNLSRDEFVEMMVVDGCFLIELFRKSSDPNLVQNNDPAVTPWLPWRVLKCLFDITWIPGMLTLPELALNFLQASIFEKEPKLNSVAKHLHLLDFVRNCMLRSCDQKLLKDGVKFECGKKDGMFNVTFENGVMKIPPITVLGESLFRNLIAYKQCDPNIISSNTPFSSYAFLMDNLINSSKDVNFLVEKKIMRCFTSPEEAASFARLNNNDCLTNFSYVDLFENVTKYHQDKWHTWGERLKRDYFGNP
ncbi:hypothetical protein PRUPE_3G141800 [Prunus persica]|uniref:Uncharacterized protein n=1 Tax=Prunus persica TaxID=3760 RepID=A0A251Q010_PRUPE|nr:hypothetical protein PRUPE_3G141800 [Prunus persica]